MNAVMTADALTKQYRKMDRPALSDLSCVLGEGEVVGLLGPNGAGKTTLVKLICGVTSRTRGGLTVCGGDPVADAPAVKRQVAAVHQSAPMDQMLPAIDQLRIAAMFRGLRWRSVRDRVDEMLALFDLDSVTDQLVFTLSGGQRRRLQLVRALLVVPRLLILDEPSAGLDVTGRRQVWELISKLSAENGTTVVWTSHYIEEIERNCSRVLIIDRGRLVRNDSPARLVAEFGRQSVLVRLPDQNDRSRLRTLLPAAQITEDGDADLTIDGAAADEQLSTLVALVRSAASRGSSIRFRQPSLEDAYVGLVGQERKGIQPS